MQKRVITAAKSKLFWPVWPRRFTYTLGTLKPVTHYSQNPCS